MKNMGWRENSFHPMFYRKKYKGVVLMKTGRKIISTILILAIVHPAV